MRRMRVNVRQIRDILETQLADTVKARRIRPDGTSERVQPDGRPLLRSQERLYELTGTIGAGDSCQTRRVEQF